MIVITNMSNGMLLLLLLPSHFSRFRLCETSWMAAHQASLSLGFSRQEYWNGLPCHSPFSAIVMYNNKTCLLHTHISGPCPAFFIFTHLYISSFTHTLIYL